MGVRRVLYLTHHLPWPAISGGRLREAELLRRLASEFQIDVVAISKAPGQDRTALPTAASHGIRASIFSVDEGRAYLRGPLTRRHRSSAARRFVANALERIRYDVIHVEGHFLVDILPTRVRERAIVVEHNIESSLFVQRARVARSLPERVRMYAHALMTHRDEVRAWRLAQATVAVTAEDAVEIQRRAPNSAVWVVPNGADHLRNGAGQSAPMGPTDRVGLVMVGNFGYQPNEDAAAWLLDEIYPRIASRCPGSTLAFVGDAPPHWLIDAAEHDPSVTVTGRVPDVSEWLDRALVVVCPLRIGGGVKVKVLEALSRGKAVVTTGLGGQGLAEIPPGALIVREDARSFAEACAGLLQDPGQRLDQEARARASTLRIPSWDRGAAALAACWLAAVTVNVHIGACT